MSSSLERENSDMRWRLRQLESQIASVQRERTGQEAADMREYAARFDAAAAALGEKAPPPTWGEDPLAYRRRLATKIAVHSTEFKNSRFDSADSAALDAIEPALYANVSAAALKTAGEGKMIAIKERDSTGREITKFHGSPRSWMQHFMTDGHSATINRYPNGE